jgi:hypothetical protein
MVPEPTTRNKTPGQAFVQHMRVLRERKELLTGPTSRHDGENDPAEDLEGVVGK